MALERRIRRVFDGHKLVRNPAEEAGLATAAIPGLRHPKLDELFECDLRRRENRYACSVGVVHGGGLRVCCCWR